MQAIPIAPEFAFPPAVRTFCENRGILDYLRFAMQLAMQTFELDGDPRLSVDADPETDEESVVIDVSSPISCDEALERERRYTLQWVQSVPPDVVGTIRLILSIA